MGTGVYIERRNGQCQHCGHRFFSSSPTPGPLCFHCKNAGKAVEDDPGEVGCIKNIQPEPITWAGYIVDAPNFTQDQFDRAMGRAFVDELEVKPDRRPGRYLVGHPQTYAYAVTREHCTCKATAPCKHRALLIAHLDIRVSAIAKQWRQLHEIRPAREAALS